MDDNSSSDDYSSHESDYDYSDFEDVSHAKTNETKDLSKLKTLLFYVFSLLNILFDVY